MIKVKFKAYTLLMSYDPCEIFTYYNVAEMHGLNLIDCMKHKNNTKQAYVAGWCNYIPKPKKDYKAGDPKFLFINLSRCGNDTEAFGLIMHELMHQSFDMHTDEEELITWAENEAYKVFQIVKNAKRKHESKRKSQRIIS
jgi:hypothetical protein